MATVAAVPCEGRSQLTCGQALSLAWASWLILLAIPALLFLAVMWTFIGDDTFADKAVAAISIRSSRRSLFHSRTRR